MVSVRGLGYPLPSHLPAHAPHATLQCTTSPHIYPLIYTPLPHSTWPYSKVRAKGTTWCIQVAEGTELDQNGLKMGSKHLFVHPECSKIAFGKLCF